MPGKRPNRQCEVLELDLSGFPTQSGVTIHWRFQHFRSRGRNISAESGVSLNMQKRWRVVLPVIGIILFSVVSYHSLRVNRGIQRAPSRYFWWSATRLDSDPVNKRNWNWGATPCQNSKENCSRWDLETIWVDPSLVEQFLILSALPAFIMGGLAVRGLGTIGINQIWSFMLSMPILICAWYYLIGWLLDRWISRRSRRRTPTPG